MASKRCYCAKCNKFTIAYRYDNSWLCQECFPFETIQYRREFIKSHIVALNGMTASIVGIRSEKPLICPRDGGRPLQTTWANIYYVTKYSGGYFKLEKEVQSGDYIYKTRC
jgi:hypothetical protein